MKKCYASVLGDCGGPISREHYISRSIINYGQPDRSNIDLAGPGGKPKPTGANGLASAKVLCKKHNEQLSRVDTEMLRLVDAVFNWYNRGRKEIQSFDASLITRWLMKFAAGSIAAQVGHGTAPEYMFQEDWLRILFGSAELPDWCGFDTTGPSDLFSVLPMIGGVPPYVVTPRFAPDGTVKGASIGVYPMELTTFFESGISYLGKSFRPTKVTLLRRATRLALTIHFKWPGGDTIDKEMIIDCF